jgi:hypothetical protein
MDDEIHEFRKAMIRIVLCYSLMAVAYVATCEGHTNCELSINDAPPYGL